jgi:hypothetical protein
LVIRKQSLLRGVLWLIIVDAIILHVPTIVLTYGSNDPYATGNWVADFNIMERIQLTCFCAQEFVISGIYLWSIVRVFNSIQHSSTRKVMTQLIIINALCIGMDIILIALEYSNRYIGEASLKPMIYAIKLKLEFVVLNQLVSLTLAGRGQVSRHRAEEYALSSNDHTAGASGLHANEAGKIGVRNSVLRLNHSSRRSVWPLSPSLQPANHAYKSYTEGVALENQQPRVQTGPVVRISAEDRPRNDSIWSRTMKRTHHTNKDDGVVDTPPSRTVRAQTTTTVISEAISPDDDAASNSSSQDKILPLHGRVLTP